VFEPRLEAWIKLLLIPGLGPRSAHALLAALGSPEAVFDQPAGRLSQIVPATLADAILAGPDAAEVAAALQWLEADGHRLITWDDADYPRAWLQISDPPPAFFFLGRSELLNRPTIAIVGSRNATRQGCENARAFAETLSRSGLTIASGLALGIDAAAHGGGLAGPGSTLAVLGTGIDRVYPARNRDLAHQIAERGGLISEFPLGTPPLAGNFPRRNRLISGLARGCLVVEATLKSGSLITARLALEQGREVFAIPGSIHSPFSKGCHRLIKDGAKLVESAQDVLEEFGVTTSATNGVDVAAHPRSGVQEAVLDALGRDPADLDTLCERTGLGADVVAATLAELEIDGLVATQAGGRYQRLG
jgi:DNA processing protein